MQIGENQIERLRWSRFNAYSGKADDFTISEYMVNGVRVHVLWNGKERVGNYPSRKAAMDVAEEVRVR